MLFLQEKGAPCRHLEAATRNEVFVIWSVQLNPGTLNVM